MPTKIANRTVEVLGAVAREVGIPDEAIARVLGAADRSPSGDRQDTDVLYLLWEAVMDHAGDPGLTMVPAARYTLSDYGLLGFICLTSATVGDAFDQVVRYSRLWADVPRMSTARGERFSLLFEYPANARLGLRCTVESGMAEVVDAVREATTRDLAPLDVRFRHPSPGDIRAHRAFFRAPVLFGCDDAGIHYPPWVADVPLVKSEPQLKAFLQQRADAELEHLPGNLTWGERVGLFLAQALPGGEATLEAAAAALGTPVRSLRRQLTREGTSFQRVLDATRAEMARAYLDRPRFTLEEVSGLLGFSEPRSFYRAFKRWTGLTPRQYRERRDPDAST